ncbi:MAG: HTH-type transcriptional activator IlvY [Desulfobulbaceae bacterium]|nr:HTH-type transcriptional activator IlvY [Desulfobulbaceae bacterium]
MDIHELIVFKHLSGSLHFGRTSQACNITPSALTRTIQRLEGEIGKKLFIRDNRSVSLTQAGERLRIYAGEAIKQWRQLQSDLSTDEENLKGEISLYSSVTAAYSILPQILSKYRENYPQIHISLQTGDAANAITKLQNREVDVTIAALPEKLPAKLEFINILDTPLIFIAPKHFQDGSKPAPSSIKWEQTPIIMAERGLGRERLSSWFKNKRIRPNIYAQVAGNEAIIAMVSLGCGIGVVPRLVLEKSPLMDQIDILDVSPKLTPFSVGVCTARKNMRNPVVKAFWDIAAREAG